MTNGSSAAISVDAPAIDDALPEDSASVEDVASEESVLSVSSKMVTGVSFCSALLPQPVDVIKNKHARLKASVRFLCAVIIMVFPKKNNIN